MKENDAIRLLVDCEQGLRKLVAEAVRGGDYAAVLRIAEWAKAVAALAAEGRGGQSAMPSVVESAEAPSGKLGASVSQPVRRTKRAPGDYPRFFRRGDELVKVGWSKKDRKEYNHRAPRKAVDAVAHAIRDVGAKGNLFRGGDLLPLKDPANGASVPDYQAYVALAWLKHLDLVRQRGRRGGYTLAKSKQIDSTITAAWPELTIWGG